ncbi:hypothetical protein GCM10011323_14790 [Pontibacter amylolyticus]|uniref:Uncharacterized protein n=1 Tax=Pontibacter amylolyticus TaxID=1424080 RepID=A0ABQ1W384_9BACT|nr:hypothetical protein GCM10011323_14790 [Pontibacter amylolyticus]
MLFPPSYQRALDPGTAILLTEGYEPDSLSALLQRLEPSPLVYTYQTQAPKAAALPDLYTFRQQQPEVQMVHVLGHGLSEQELLALQNTTVIPHLSGMPAGITSITWPDVVVLGEAVAVAGQYNLHSAEETTLYLQAAGQAQDSVIFKEAGQQPFQLRYTPKQQGRYTCNLISKSGNNMDTLGQVPVQVYPASKPAVLLVSSFPLFEFKFLKNHLGQLQHKVALRSTVSKGMYQSEWLNMPQTDLSRITPRLLQQFDVVIIEPQALQELRSAERSALQQAVTVDGLGVLTVAGEQLGNRTTAFFTNFQSKRLSQQDIRNARANWINGEPAAIPVSPYTLVSSEAVTGLIEEQSNNLLAASRRSGWGTVALSVVPQTFSWQLEGKQTTYASYWAHLLSSVAKREVREKFWQVAKPQMPQVQQPLTLKQTDYTLTEASAIPAATVRSTTDSTHTGIALQQGVHQPEVYEGTFWPHRTGWHVVESPGVEPFYFLVQDSAAWLHQSVQAKREATTQFASQQQRSSGTAGTTAYATEEVPVIWFFVLFVLSGSFLWLEEKL